MPLPSLLGGSLLSEKVWLCTRFANAPEPAFPQRGGMNVVRGCGVVRSGLAGTTTRAFCFFGARVFCRALRVKTIAMIGIKGKLQIDPVPVRQLEPEAAAQIKHGFRVRHIARQMVAQFVHKQEGVPGLSFERNNGIAKHPKAQHIAVVQMGAHGIQVFDQRAIL